MYCAGFAGVIDAGMSIFSTLAKCSLETIVVAFVAAVNTEHGFANADIVNFFLV